MGIESGSQPGPTDEPWASIDTSAGDDAEKSDSGQPNNEQIEKSRDEVLSQVLEQYFPNQDFLSLIRHDHPEYDNETLEEAAYFQTKQYESSREEIYTRLERLDLTTEEKEGMARSVAEATWLSAQRAKEIANVKTQTGPGDDDFKLEYVKMDPRPAYIPYRAMQIASNELQNIDTPKQAESYLDFVKDLVRIQEETGDELVLPRLSEISVQISGRNTTPRPPTHSDIEYEASLSALSHFAKQIGEKRSLIPEEDSVSKEGGLLGRAITIGANARNPERLNVITEALNSIPESSPSIFFEKTINLMLSYSRTHSMSQEEGRTLAAELYTALKNHDSQVEALQSPRNNFGMSEGDYGIADYIIKCYASEYSPVNIKTLQIIDKELPTSDFHKFEQNRSDGYLLASKFGGLRDFVHDQRPGVHEVIEAMINFYDSGDSTDLQKTLDTFGEGYIGEGTSSYSRILDRDNYLTNIVRQSGETFSVIDVLRRLDQNTVPTTDEPPVTSYMSDIVANMYSAVSSQNKEGFGSYLATVVEDLKSKIDQHEKVISPEVVKVIEWVERSCFKILQNITYEDQQGLTRQGWFQKILEFQELTASSQPFNQEDFSQLIETTSTARDYDDTAKPIVSRVSERIHGLAQQYKSEGHPEWVATLWSGNTDHELLGLMDPRPAITAYGKRHRAEKLIPRHLRNTGD